MFPRCPKRFQNPSVFQDQHVARVGLVVMEPAEVDHLAQKEPLQKKNGELDAEKRQAIRGVMGVQVGTNGLAPAYRASLSSPLRNLFAQPLPIWTPQIKIPIHPLTKGHFNLQATAVG